MFKKKRHKYEQFQDMIARIYPEITSANLKKEYKDINGDTIKEVVSRTVTFQVTDACNLACSYCYQINKGKRRMKFETAKRFIDLLLSGDKNMDTYINPNISPAIIIEFIGGEPFLEIELIEQICDYFVEQAILLEHPWAEKFSFSICSNGTLYFDSKVQNFLQKYHDLVSFSVTIDGNKELHDACRVFPDGSPSYDKAVAAAKDWINRGYYMGSKITIAPANVKFLYDAIVHMIELGYEDIHANCVYEKGWEQHHATEYYYQLKKIADYMIENNLSEDIDFVIFNDNYFKPKSEDDIKNWCGGTGSMLACDPDGYLYPCIRYMESSLGNTREPMRIGDVWNGIGCNQQCKDCIKLLHSINRKTQSTEECFNCPIAEGCAWCSAYNYQEFGTPDKRATYICEMHKAEALANVYYWNTLYLKCNMDNVFINNVPDEWALKIIPKEELDMLKKLYLRGNNNEN